MYPYRELDDSRLQPVHYSALGRFYPAHDEIDSRLNTRFNGHINLQNIQPPSESPGSVTKTIINSMQGDLRDEMMALVRMAGSIEEVVRLIKSSRNLAETVGMARAYIGLENAVQKLSKTTDHFSYRNAYAADNKILSSTGFPISDSNHGNHQQPFKSCPPGQDKMCQS